MKIYRILLLTLCTYALVSCGGAEERKAVYLEKAKASIEAGDFDKARIELKNVLQIDPKDSEARFQLGKVHEQHKDYRKAFANYKKAEELNPDLLENKARLGRLYLLLANDMEEAQSRIDFILTKDPTHSEGLLLKAASLIKRDKKSEAVRIGQDILARDPANIDTVNFVATMYIKDKKISEALYVLETALKLKPENDQLNNLLAQVYIQNKKYEKAEVVYNKFLEKYPDDAKSYMRLAALYSVMEDKDGAEKILRLSIENTPEDVKRYLTLVKYINDVNGKDAAVNEMKAAVAKQNNIGKLRIALGEILLLSGDEKGAVDVYTNAVKDFPEDQTGIEARIALTSIYFNEGDFQRAEEIVEDAILISSSNPKINFIRARLAILAKDTGKAIISLRIVIKETPGNIDAYILLVNAYALNNNAVQMEDTLKTAYQNNKTNPAALLKLAKYYLSRDFNKAEKIIDTYNGLKDSDYEGMSIKAVILNKNNDSGVHDLANKIIEMYPGRPNGYLQSVPYLSQQGDIKSAVSILEKGYINVKDNRKILELLSNLQVHEKEFHVVEKRIKAELVSSPDDEVLKLLLAKVYLADDNSRGAEILLNEVVISKPAAEEPYLLLSYIYKNNNNSNKIILEKGKENVALSYKIPLKLAALYEVDSEYQKAINVYRDMYKKLPENMVVVNNLASLLSDYSDKKEDLELMKLLVEKLRKSEQHIFLDTIGWVSYKLGDYQAAIKYLSEVIIKAPEINIFNYHLGMAYKMAGDTANAKIYLEKSLATGKSFNGREKAQTALQEI